MSKLINGIKMIQLLQTNGKMKIKEIAQELNMEKRTIRKYKEELVDVGVKIKSEPGARGGYILEEAVFTEKFTKEIETKN